MTYNTFYQRVCEFRNRFQNRELETYLLAILRFVNQHNARSLDAESLLKLLQDAFTADPEAFNPEWLSIMIAPEPIDKTVASDKSGIDYTIAVLQFQIAELHKMKGKQLENDMRYFGLPSETGNLWSNFDPMTNLECGASCMLDNQADEDAEFHANWQTLGELLEMGRIYE